MRTATTWTCATCDAHGTEDREAQRHTERSGHSTTTRTTPEGKP